MRGGRRDKGVSERDRERGQREAGEGEEMKEEEDSYITSKACG